MAWFLLPPSHFPLAPLAVFLLLPFVPLSTYLAPSSCDRNRPPSSQVVCKLTLFAPPFTQLSHPFQLPRTPTTQSPNNDDIGTTPLLLCGTSTMALSGQSDATAPFQQSAILSVTLTLTFRSLSILESQAILWSKGDSGLSYSRIDEIPVSHLTQTENCRKVILIRQSHLTNC